MLNCVIPGFVCRRSKMNSYTIAAVAIFFVVGVVIATIALVWMAVRNSRTKQLKSRFGPEYRRVARAEGGASEAESILLAREKRVKKLDIKPLTEAQRNEFADIWEHAQAEFVDDPVAAVSHADVLVQEVMDS